MGETARVFEVATASELPVLAHLSLELHLVALDKLLSLLLALEMPLGFLDCGELVILLYPSLFDMLGPLYTTLLSRFRPGCGLLLNGNVLLKALHWGSLQLGIVLK